MKDKFSQQRQFFTAGNSNPTMVTMKTSYSLFILFILFSCNQSNDTKADKSIESTPIGSNATNAISEYQHFISQLDTSNVQTATIAAKKYQELFTNEPPEIKDKAFVIFNAHYERLDRTINALHEKDTTNFDPLISLDASGKALPISEKLKAYNDKLKRNGFEVSSSEGISYIMQDRDFFANWFYSYVSPTMKAYLLQLNKENKEGFGEDAGLIIDPKQFVDRLVWWEDFIKNDTLFILRNEAKERKKDLLTFFVNGMDNSPIVDYATNKINDYYRKAYSYLQDTYPNSETNKVVNPYFKALSTMNNKKASEILNDYKKKGIIFSF